MKYFIIESNRQAGPFTTDELRDRNITSDTLVWTEGMDAWTPAWQVEELRNMLYNPTPQTTPPPIPQAPQPEPQQQYAPQPHNHTRQPGRKSILTAAVITLIVMVLAVTCPGKQSHKEAIRNGITDIIERNTGGGNGLLSQGLGMINKLITAQMVIPLVDSMLKYHNYIVFSTTTIDLNGQTQTVSYGILGQVFTVDADYADKLLNGSDEQPQDDSDSTTDSANDEEETYI